MQLITTLIAEVTFGAPGLMAATKKSGTVIDGVPEATVVSILISPLLR